MEPHVAAALAVFAHSTAWFAVSLFRKRNDVADVAWGLGACVLAWTSFALADNPGERWLLVSLMVTAWGLRLAWYVHARNVGRAEDSRYAQWRREWGKTFVVRSYLQVYLLQGILLFFVCLPVLWAHRGGGVPLGVFDAVGILIWCAGFCFETVADFQLLRFLKNPDRGGKLLKSGLWAYSRHPNYFGEVALWWGLWLFVLPVPGAWMSVIGPVLISFLILRVSGIPMLERKMADHPEFAEYARSVNVFFPWFPKGRGWRR